MWPGDQTTLSMNQNTSSRTYELEHLFGLAHPFGVDETLIEQVRGWHVVWAVVVLAPIGTEASEPTAEQDPRPPPMRCGKHASLRMV
jgi:hypothetical protein